MAAVKMHPDIYWAPWKRQK